MKWSYSTIKKVDLPPLEFDVQVEPSVSHITY
jgi:hypothetical protein